MTMRGRRWGGSLPSNGLELGAEVGGREGADNEVVGGEVEGVGAVGIAVFGEEEDDGDVVAFLDLGEKGKVVDAWELDVEKDGGGPHLLEGGENVILEGSRDDVEAFEAKLQLEEPDDGRQLVDYQDEGTESIAMGLLEGRGVSTKRLKGGATAVLTVGRHDQDFIDSGRAIWYKCLNA